MASKIALLYSDDALAKTARDTIHSYDRSVDVHNVELNKISCLSDLDDLADSLRSYGAVVFCGVENSSRIPSVVYLQKKLGLYANAYHFQDCDARTGNDFWIVFDGIGETYVAESGYGNNKNFGREAFDIIRCSELEIERTARIAYEIAQKHKLPLTISDKADVLETSRLYRKIVTDINEDYADVYVNTEYIQHSIASMDSNKQGVLFLPNIFAEIAVSTAERVFEKKHSILVGDTPFACCICANEEEIPQACKDVLEWSFEIF